MFSRIATFLTGFTLGALLVAYLRRKPLFECEAPLVFRNGEGGDVVETIDMAELDDGMIAKLDALSNEYQDKYDAIIAESRASISE